MNIKGFDTLLARQNVVSHRLEPLCWVWLIAPTADQLHGLENLPMLDSAGTPLFAHSFHFASDICLCLLSVAWNQVGFAGIFMS